jgi:hypothetical protein
MSQFKADDPLLVACSAMMREAGGYAMDPERLAAALPVIRGTLAAIRTLDELDLDGVEPMTTFRPLPRSQP